MCFCFVVTVFWGWGSWEDNFEHSSAHVNVLLCPFKEAKIVFGMVEIGITEKVTCFNHSSRVRQVSSGCFLMGLGAWAKKLSAPTFQQFMLCCFAAPSRKTPAEDDQHQPRGSTCACLGTLWDMLWRIAPLCILCSLKKPRAQTTHKGHGCKSTFSVMARLMNHLPDVLCPFKQT